MRKMAINGLFLLIPLNMSPGRSSIKIMTPFSRGSFGLIQCLANFLPITRNEHIHMLFVTRQGRNQLITVFPVLNTMSGSWASSKDC